MRSLASPVAGYESLGWYREIAISSKVSHVLWLLNSHASGCTGIRQCVSPIYLYDMSNCDDMFGNMQCDICRCVWWLIYRTTDMHTAMLTHWPNVCAGIIHGDSLNRHTLYSYDMWFLCVIIFHFKVYKLLTNIVCERTCCECRHIPHA